MSALTFENPVFRQYAFYGTLLVGKAVIMTPLTSFLRVTREVYSNEEDLALSKNKDLQPNFNDLVVERVRRCHQNDLENIIPFAVIGAVYVACEPHPVIARRLFQIFAIARFIHTTSYLLKIRQPVRFLSATVGVMVNLVMVWRVQHVLRFY